MHVCCVRLLGWFFFVGGSYYSIYYWHREKDLSEEVMGQGGGVCGGVTKGLLPPTWRRQRLFRRLSLSCPYPPGKEEEEDTKDDDDDDEEEKRRRGRQSDGRDLKISGFHMYTRLLLASRSCRHAVSPFHLLCIPPSFTHSHTHHYYNPQKRATPITTTFRKEIQHK